MHYLKKEHKYLIQQILETPHSITFVLDSKMDIVYTCNRSDLTDFFTHLYAEFLLQVKDKMQEILKSNQTVVSWKTNISQKKCNATIYEFLSDNNLLFIVHIKVIEQKMMLPTNLTELESIIKYIPGSIFWKDTAGRYMGCNDFVLEMAGLKSKEDIIGKKDTELYWKDYADKIREVDLRVMQLKQKLIMEETIIKASGEEFIAISYKGPLLNLKNEVIGVVGVAIDIRELKETQARLEKALVEAKQANAARESILERYQRFMDDQGHDIRTPIGGIVAGCAVLQEMLDGLSPEAAEWVTEVHKAATQVLEYQESLLFDLYHGLRRGKTIFARFNLSDIVKRIYTLYQPAAKAKRLSFTYEYDAAIPAYLIGDSKRIYQCLLDLVSNALRFTHQGAVSIIVKLNHLHGNTAIVRFSVLDTGIGIAAEMQHEIYEAFVKVAPSYQTQTQGHGRGLGLSRVQHLVNLLHGELWLESEIGKGSCFNMSIPLKVSIDQKG